MPHDLAKIKIDPAAFDTLSEAAKRLGDAARGLSGTGAIAEALKGSFATSKILADIERSNRLWADHLTSPLTDLYSQNRLLGESVSSQLAALTEGSSIMKMAEQIRQITEGAGAFQHQLKVLSDDSSLAAAFRQSERLADMFKATYAFDNRAMGIASLSAVDLSMYTLPVHNEIGAISRLLEEQMAPLRRFSDGIASAMEGMRTPWLSIENPLISATAFAELQTVGQMIGTRAPFGIDLSATLRESLGDWRDPISGSLDVETYETRARSYADHGFRQELVEFPDEAFDETLVLAGLVPLDEEVDPETAAGLRRARAIEHLLQDLEVRLRRMIDAAMTRAFGPQWMMGRTPNGMADQWEEKRDKDSMAIGLPLVEYADFTDYALIVTRADNWRLVFRHLFGRRMEDVRESFQRLQPARITVAHHRPLGRDDYLLAAAEIRRLLLVIARRRPN